MINPELRPKVRLARREREKIVYDLTMAGVPQREIAEQVGVSQGTVSQTVARIDKRALAELVDKSDTWKACNTLRLQNIYRKAMNAWERSQKDAEMERVTLDGDGKTSKQNTRRGQAGDARFLDIARGALQDIAKLWGMNDEQQHGNGATNITIKVEYSDDFFGHDRIVDGRAAVVDVVTEPVALLERTPQDEATNETNNAT